ncbi:hypothetical protein J3L18_17230 [Mucilaginibacter gossypii]|uniref:hypothetical protein n=1 Tax=Mucilaginibacter gossypii TaxID=551996 RepID=UPI000DCBDB2A|nr:MULTISPECIES: hypothetical protein [Mucilaginibacter]QTE34891.1 hypothetical protein J3L18_17230 [Mucilaginibacter gossypii]RAV59592.1 hypothetical protein DIU36_05035 [Mucilaginibacter rubeus]
MKNKRNDSRPVPPEAPSVPPQPEVKPSAEPVVPVSPAEAPATKPQELPQEPSPYDFPPPGEGLFPELF